jgi:sorting and assembly machinery component 37
MPYITPPALRSAAKARTEHLGLSSLDVDTNEAEQEEKEKQNPIPPHLRTSTKSLTSLLSSSPESNVLIRLDALATAFLDPIQSLRGKNRFFVGTHPTSLDCLAFGYLALMLLPDLPSPWLAKCMRQKYQQLSASVHSFKQQNLGASPHSLLPWIEPSQPSLKALAGTFASSIGNHLPIISSIKETATLKTELEAEAEDDEDREAIAHLVSSRQRETWTTAASVTIGISLFVGFVSYYNVLNGSSLGFGLFGLGTARHAEDKPRENTGRLGRFGDAGEALNALF